MKEGGESLRVDFKKTLKIISYMLYIFSLQN